MAAPDKTVLLGRWTVESINERPVSDGQLVFMQFTGDGRVAGKASYNRFTGGYTLSGSELRFAQMASTRMACAELLMEQERCFLVALSLVVRVCIENGVLVLTDTDGNDLVKARRSEDTP
jgi:heat shock protein HslJ